MGLGLSRSSLPLLPAGLRCGATGVAAAAPSRSGADGAERRRAAATVLCFPWRDAAVARFQDAVDGPEAGEASTCVDASGVVGTVPAEVFEVEPADLFRRGGAGAASVFGADAAGTERGVAVREPCDGETRPVAGAAWLGLLKALGRRERGGELTNCSRAASGVEAPWLAAVAFGGRPEMSRPEDRFAVLFCRSFAFPALPMLRGEGGGAGRGMNRGRAGWGGEMAG